MGGVKAPQKDMCQYPMRNKRCKLLIGAALACNLALAHDVNIASSRRHGRPPSSLWQTRSLPIDLGNNTSRRRKHRRSILGWRDLRGGGDFIQVNPDYDGEETDSGNQNRDDEDESSEDKDISSDEEDNAFISHSKCNMRRSKRSKSSHFRTLLRQLHQNQLNFYILLAVIAFRKDIAQFIIQYKIIPTQVDPVTGKRRLNIKWSTDGLKLLIVLQLVRLYFIPAKIKSTKMRSLASIEKKKDKMANETQYHLEDDGDGKGSPPIIPLLILLSVLILLLGKNTSFLLSHPFLLPIITSFIFRSLRNADPDSLLSQILTFGSKEELVIHQAYIPHVEQHYTFEQLNERYYRDWAAWRKAFPANGLVAHQHHRGEIMKDDSGVKDNFGRRKKMSSLLSSLMQPRKDIASTHGVNSVSSARSLADTYPRDYTNGTVIVLDLTKLDTQASKMDFIRDQISFLIHLVENEDSSFFCRDNNSTGSGDSPVKPDERDVTLNSTALTFVSGTDCNATISYPSSAVCNTENTTHSIQTKLGDGSADEPPNKLEIIILLESPGGAVSSYGLASSHLQRLRSTPGVKLTICIDTVAASGGYMMACMASPGQLYCAPFAMVGSIGVIGQSLNVQKTLEKYGVRPYVFRGGKMKNPVGMVGDVTKEGIGAMQDMVDRIHDAFREHVAKARESSLVQALRPLPNSKYYQMGDTKCETGVMSVIDQVATGDVFLGIQALKLGLVDRLITSDEYIFERIQDGARALKLVVYQKPVTLSSLLTGHSLPQRNPQMSNYDQGLFRGLLKSVLKCDRSYQVL
ncbi:hypothetical protein HJC23_003002 [Cyclotella cryptica]|uniref:Peptidase S49 domain-containing protein n=1 Tax=Cyclotella cryptica TaxID=29204 RepID=A0ABD3PT54_9STRA